jgi:hypothetical protein
VTGVMLVDSVRQARHPDGVDVRAARTGVQRGRSILVEYDFWEP